MVSYSISCKLAFRMGGMQTIDLICILTWLWIKGEAKRGLVLRVKLRWPKRDHSLDVTHPLEMVQIMLFEVVGWLWVFFILSHLMLAIKPSNVV